MIDIYLPMAGHGERASDIMNIPKQLFPLSDETVIMQQTLDIMINGILQAKMTPRIIASVPSGTAHWDRFGYMISDYMYHHYRMFPYYIRRQSELLGSLGEVLSLMEWAYEEASEEVTGCFILYPDTLIATTPEQIASICRDECGNYFGITPKQWDGGDGVQVSIGNISSIYQHNESTGFSPAGILKVSNQHNFKEALKKSCQYPFGFRDYAGWDQFRTWCIPQIIDCGTPHGYSEAKRLYEEGNGNVFYKHKAI